MAREHLRGHEGRGRAGGLLLRRPARGRLPLVSAPHGDLALRPGGCGERVRLARLRRCGARRALRFPGGTGRGPLDDLRRRRRRRDPEAARRSGVGAHPPRLQRPRLRTFRAAISRRRSSSACPASATSSPRRRSTWPFSVPCRPSTTTRARAATGAGTREFDIDACADEMLRAAREAAGGIV